MRAFSFRVEMPNHAHCIVPGCSNRRNKCKFGLFPSEEPVHGRHVYVKKRLCGSMESRKGCDCTEEVCMKLQFHRFPKDCESRQKVRREWLAKIPRQNTVANDNSYVCGIHFPGGCRSDIDEPPTIFLGGAVPRFRGTRVALGTLLRDEDAEEMHEEDFQVDQVDMVSSQSFSEHSYSALHPEKRIQDLEKLVEKLQHKLDCSQFELQECKSLLATCRLSHESMENDDEKLLFYTGLSRKSYDVFQKLMLDKMTGMSYSSNVSADYIEHDQRGRPRTLSPADELLLTVIKLRHNFPETDLGNRFGVTQSTVSRVFSAVVRCISYTFKELIIWPSRELIDRYMPTAFWTKYPKTQVVIDATEIPIEKPANPKVQAATWSNYKNRNTFKLLIGVTPNGCLSFLSSLWGGRISDKELTKRCGILDCLEEGDTLMADRGFDIALLMPKGVELNIPPFLGSRDQLEPEEVTATRRIASVRIHVERAIERLKNYRILHFIPSSLCPIAEHMVNACAFLTQFMEPLVPPPAPEQANTRASSASVAQPVRSMTDTDPCSLPPESFAPVNLMKEEVCRAMDESDSHVAAATEAPVINLDTSSYLPQPCFSCGIADHRLLRQCPLCARRFHHMCQNDDDETGRLRNTCYARA